MLQTIRDNSKGIIAKTIVGLIALTFVLWGAESLIGLGSKEKPAAEVNGEDIAVVDLMRGVDLQRRQLLMQMGPDADPTLLDDNLMGRQVLESLIEQSLLIQSANRQGLYLSEDMLDQIIVSSPGFQVDGRFDRNQFEMVLRNAGFTPLMYRERLRKETLVDQERAALILSAFSTPDEVERVVRLDQQKRDLAWVRLPLLKLLNETSVTESEIRDLYDQRATALQTPEQVVLDYVLLDKNDFVDPSQVSDDEVRGIYEQMLADFVSEEERSASHILIEITDERDELAALAKAQELSLQLESGADFAELAQQNSDDPGSAGQGGSMGYLTREVLADEFADTLFAMSDVGQVSDPVQTEFGFHLIRLDGLRQAEQPTFAEAAYDLRLEIAERDAELRYVEQMERLADLSFSAADLIVPAEELDLVIERSEPISREGGADELGRNSRVVEAAFSNDLLRERLNSLPIELDRERTVVVRVQEHLPSRQVTYEEVRDELELELITERATERLEQQASEWLNALQEGETLAQLSDDYSWVEVSDADRGDSRVPSEIRQRAFAMQGSQSPDFELMQLRDGNFAIIRLDAVHQSDVELSAEEMALMMSLLGATQGQQDYQNRVESLRESATIKRN
ncbi:SurA N-terminal domain-containing protein [Nitrincola sp.]|uniref:SurA N-terminal domain-containing protein n=1 Tax=Nitrincola sp. TaxID=1926584 RepID=UPI003A94F101